MAIYLSSAAVLALIAIATIRYPTIMLTWVGILAPLQAVAGHSLQVSVAGLYLTPGEVVLYPVVFGLAVRLLARPRLRWRLERGVVTWAWMLLLSLIPGTVLAVASREIAFKAWLGLAQWVVWATLAMACLELRDIRRLQRGWLILATVGALVDIGSVWVFGLSRVSGIMNDPNYWGVFLGLNVVLLAVSRGRGFRATRAAWIALLVTSGVLSGSRSFLLTGALMVAVWAVLGFKIRRPSLALGLPLIGLMVGVSILALGMVSGVGQVEHLYGRGLAARLQVFEWSLINAPRYMMLGIGPENMQLVYDEWSPYATPLESGKSAHNMYLQVVIAGGVVAGACFAAILGRILRRLGQAVSARATESLRDRALISLSQVTVLIIQGFFLNLAWEPFFWATIACAAVTIEEVRVQARLRTWKANGFRAPGAARQERSSTGVNDHIHCTRSVAEFRQLRW